MMVGPTMDGNKKKGSVYSSFIKTIELFLTLDYFFNFGTGINIILKPFESSSLAEKFRKKAEKLDKLNKQLQEYSADYQFAEHMYYDNPYLNYYSASR